METNCQIRVRINESREINESYKKNYMQINESQKEIAKINESRVNPRDKYTVCAKSRVKRIVWKPRD